MKQKLVPKIFLVLLFFILLKPGDAHSQCTDLTQTAHNMGRFDYVLWSSPVTSFLINDVSPNTLPDKFYRFDQATNNWANVDPLTTQMTPGIGYLIRGPNDYWPYCTGCTLQDYTAPFSGTPNSGTISVPISVIGTSNFNLIGNPYCNDVMADCFIRDTDNGSINGTLYFWTHNIPIDWTPNGTTNPPNPQVDGVYNYNSNAYAAYNLLGGVAAGYTANASTSYLTLNRPDGFIARAQGFFVTGLANNSTAYFKDTMRANYNAYFFKADEPVTNDNPPAPPGSCEVQNKHRLWLQMTMGTLFKETLVGYAPTTDGATTGPGLDRNFDGVQSPPSVGQPYVNLYSLSPGSTANLAIQARALPFNVNDVIALGYDTNTSGNATISVRNIDYDGLFINQDFWLRETIGSSPPSYRHIKVNPYTFPVTSAPTDANTRFQVVFRLPNTANLLSTYCGGPAAQMFVTPYIVGMPYHYLITCPSDPTFIREVTGANSLNLTTLVGPGILLGTTYTIQVAYYQVDGQWVYGTPCNVTTDALPPTRNITPCEGLEISNYNQSLYAGNGTIYGVAPTQYRFRVTDPASVTYTMTRTVSSFSLRMLANTNPAFVPQPDTVYGVEVAIEYKGVWYDFGSLCHVHTTATATGKTDLTTQFSAELYPNPFANSFKIDVATGSNDPIDAIVYDMIGREIERFKLNANEMNSQEIGVKYPTGVYNIVVKQGDNVQKLRGVKK